MGDKDRQKTILGYEQVFESICRDDRYLRNLDWGRPRRGHPEGTIRAHIQQLECNLEMLRDRVSEQDCWKLKVLIHIHDTFKPDAKQNVPILDPCSHASLAATFLAAYCDDDELITIAQWHDEPYAIWRKRTRSSDISTKRFDQLCQRISNWDLFLAFLLIDGCAAGKSEAPMIWFFTKIGQSIDSQFSVEDVLAMASPNAK